ncbi:MAG: DNA repair protein RecO [Rubrimonas sp.]|uniref:DNA repair protein RecO n=1 Tax=Rubrimonas sp. TaxID=2036015 RepID=UPI002FDDC554
MISWRDEGAILAARRHGEADAIVDVFTADHGRCAAVVKGGAGRRLSPVLQPGEQVALDWRARLETHLGSARVEPLRARAGAIMADRRALAALASASALLCAFLPEAEPHPTLYARSLALFDALAEGLDWPPLYARWELSLLEETGFGLDLTSCAATGARDDLVWVSPRSGQAVSGSAGAPYADRLLRLPAFLRDPSAEAGAPRIAEALRLTGWFLHHRAAPAFGRDALPAARARLADLLSP